MASGRGPTQLPMPTGKPPAFMSEDRVASKENWLSGLEKEIKKGKEPRGPELDVERCRDKEMDTLMGKAYRNPLTGEVTLKDYGMFPDFVVADLWTRKGLSGEVGTMAQDPYLFKVIPLTTRTWIYHHLFRGGKALSQSGATEDAMIRGVLAMSCIDADVAGGKWASVMFYAPMVLVMCVSRDVIAVLGGIGAICLTLAVTFFMNNPDHYRLIRIATWPIRAAFFLWTLWRMGATENSTALTAFGFVFALIFTVLEMCFGDCGALQAYRMHCNYEVLRPLPNRIFICRRHGAAHSQEIFGTLMPPDEKITGIAFDAWQSDFALLADVKGLVVELKPMTQNEWQAAYQEKDLNGTIVRYIGLDVFAPGKATIKSLLAALAEQNEIAQQRKLFTTQGGDTTVAQLQQTRKEDEVQVLDA